MFPLSGFCLCLYQSSWHPSRSPRVSGARGGKAQGGEYNSALLRPPFLQAGPHPSERQAAPLPRVDTGPLLPAQAREADECYVPLGRGGGPGQGARGGGGAACPTPVPSLGLAKAFAESELGLPWPLHALPRSVTPPWATQVAAQHTVPASPAPIF